MTKRVAVMNTAFRDGFQSCVGARVNTDDFLPALEAAVAAFASAAALIRTGGERCSPYAMR